MDRDDNFFERTRTRFMGNLRDLSGGLFEKGSPFRRGVTEATSDFFEERREDVRSLGFGKDDVTPVDVAREIPGSVADVGRGAGNFVVGGIRELAFRTPARGMVSINEAIRARRGDHRLSTIDPTNSRFSQFLFGSEPLESFQTADREAMEAAEALGANPVQRNLLRFAGIGLLASDYLPGGKFVSDLAQRLKREGVEEVEQRLAREFADVSEAEARRLANDIGNESNPRRIQNTLDDLRRRRFLSRGFSRSAPDAEDSISRTRYNRFLENNAEAQRTAAAVGRRASQINDDTARDRFLTRARDAFDADFLRRYVNQNPDDVLARNRLTSLENTVRTVADTLRGAREALRLSRAEVRSQLAENGVIPESATASDTITVFRASEAGDIAPGDMVTTSREVAERYARERPNASISQERVPLRHLVKSEGLQSEFVFAPKDKQEKLRDIDRSLKPDKGELVEPSSKRTFERTGLRNQLRGEERIAKRAKRSTKRTEQVAAKRQVAFEKRATKAAVRQGKQAVKETARTVKRETKEDIKNRALVKEIRERVERAVRTKMKKEKEAVKTLDKVTQGSARTSIKAIEKAYEEAGLEFPERLRREAEDALIDKVLKTARGDTKEIRRRLKKLGIRKEYIDSAVVADKYRLSSTIKIKREANGEVSAAIDEGYLAAIKKAYTGEVANDDTYIPKMSGKAVKDLTEKNIHPFEIPQNYFDRIGLKKFIYDPVREGERAGERMYRELERELREVYQPLLGWGSKKTESRKRIFRFFAAKQGKANDMINRGVMPVTYEELTPDERRVVRKLREINLRYADDIVSLAKKQGIDIDKVDEWYFPLYRSKDLYQIGDGADVTPQAIRKNPFFRSLKAREENVDYRLYEEDSFKTIMDWAQGASRFLNVGKRTLPLKYLIESDEFKDIVGDRNFDFIRNGWFAQVTTPKQNHWAFKWLKRVAFVRLLGGNLLTVAKQPISALNMQFIEGLPARVSLSAKQLSRGKSVSGRPLSAMSAPSVSERQPYIGIQDLQSSYDRAMFAGISFMDKLTAANSLERLITKQLDAAKKNGQEINTKLVREIMRASADSVDLAFGGATAAQRPSLYNTPLGEAALALTSTVNSQFQYQIKNGVKGIRDRDVKLIAGVMTAVVLSAYADQAITRMTWGFGSPEEAEETTKEMLKSVAGQVPLLGSLIFAMETENTYQPSILLDQLALGAEALWEKDPAALAMFLGVPKQIFRTAEGVQGVVAEEVEVGGQTVEITTLDEKVRLLLKGKYGALASQAVFEDDPTLKERNTTKRFDKEEIHAFEQTLVESLKNGELTKRQFDYRLNDFHDNQAKNWYEFLKDKSPEEQRELTRGMSNRMAESILEYRDDLMRDEMEKIHDKMLGLSPEEQRELTEDLSVKEKQMILDIHEDYEKEEKRKQKIIDEFYNEDN